LRDVFLTHSLFGQGSSAKAAAVLAMALLAGCAAGRNSVKPDAVALGPQALDAGSAVAGAALEHNQPPTASWWKGYGDAQLDDLVEMALAHNPTMDMAAAGFGRRKARSIRCTPIFARCPVRSSAPLPRRFGIAVPVSIKAIWSMA
jgi:hypothetical protein